MSEVVVPRWSAEDVAIKDFMLLTNFNDNIHYPNTFGKKIFIAKIIHIV